jgi:hypothetical protein
MEGRGKKLVDEPLHLGLKATTKSLTKITGMEWYEAYAKETESDGIEGRLVSMYEFTESWKEWEMHPLGEEAVICTAGEIIMYQDVAGDEVKVTKTTLKAGEYAVNPKGIWHTADVPRSCCCIFITPGQGTQTKPRTQIT